MNQEMYEQFVQEELPIYNNIMQEDNVVRRFYSSDTLSDDEASHPDPLIRFPVFDNLEMTDEMTEAKDIFEAKIDVTPRSITDEDDESAFVESFYDDNKIKDVISMPIVKENFCIAGGSVVSHIISKHNYSDVDLFPIGCNDVAVKEAIVDVYKMVKDKYINVSIKYTSYAVTIDYSQPTKNTSTIKHIILQFILQNNRTLAEVLCRFDINCCAFGIYNDKVYGTGLSVHAMTTLTNVIDPSKQNGSYGHRLHKYRIRGFAIYVPGYSSIKDRKIEDVCELKVLEDMSDISNETKIMSSRYEFLAGDIVNVRGFDMVYKLFCEKKNILYTNYDVNMIRPRNETYIRFYSSKTFMSK